MVTFIFHHLVDVTALWHISKVFESSLNNLIFFSMPVNLNRIIWSFVLKEKQILTQAEHFLAVQGQLRIFGKLPQRKSGWRKGRKNNFLQDFLSILIEVKVKIKFAFTFYFMSFWLDFSWISNLENRSKKVNLLVFVVLNMHVCHHQRHRSSF